MIIKNWKEWFIQKVFIHEDGSRASYTEREVWFARLGANIGFEQDGKGEHFMRPVIVVKKFNEQIFWGIPTTKKERNGVFYYKFQYKHSLATTAIISQLKTVDSKRLRYKIGNISENDFTELKKRIISFLK